MKEWQHPIPIKCCGKLSTNTDNGVLLINIISIHQRNPKTSVTSTSTTYTLKPGRASVAHVLPECTVQLVQWHPWYNHTCFQRALPAILPLSWSSRWPQPSSTYAFQQRLSCGVICGAARQPPVRPTRSSPHSRHTLKVPPLPGWLPGTRLPTTHNITLNYRTILGESETRGHRRKNTGLYQQENKGCVCVYYTNCSSLRKKIVLLMVMVFVEIWQ